MQPEVTPVEAGTTEDGQPVRVSVDSIIDQIHQHWARLMAAQIQHNAELSAAVSALSDENAELKSKLAALTSDLG